VNFTVSSLNISDPSHPNEESSRRKKFENLKKKRKNSLKNKHFLKHTHN
jgi:hypothetical protein